MKENSKTVLWNDSADPKELKDALTWGIVGATCNPVIALSAITGLQVAPTIPQVRASLSSLGSAESFQRTVFEFSFMNRNGDCVMFPPLIVR